MKNLTTFKAGWRHLQSLVLGFSPTPGGLVQLLSPGRVDSADHLGQRQGGRLVEGGAASDR